MKQDFSQLDQTFDADDYEYLNLHASAVLAAIEKLVRDGAMPEQIKAHCAQRMGVERNAFVIRCEGAARHLRSLQVQT